LLGALPGARPLLAWEALEPVPALDWRPPAEPLADPRVSRARTAEKFLGWISPDLFAVHPMDATAPEEDVMILDKVFMSGVSESTFRVPSFGAWLEQQDQTPAYRWLERCLRHLQLQRSADASFWVLKSPHHLEWLDTVFEVFPDITVIQTHRAPRVTVPSFCSLVAHGWGVMSDTVDPREVGRYWLRKIDRMLSRALETRERRGGAGFIDVDYSELTGDPLGVMERLCGQLGLPWSERTRSELEGWLATNRQHKHGVHRYAAEDFGLTEGEIDERFAAYSRKFL
ncbi:MAG: sulfotransferase, partial [Myxococcales bacterium]|nr:sulfotransferase [Myxococcales bacterium]